MDIYDFTAIVTSTRLTPSEEAELRSASESVDHPPSPFSLPLAEGKGTPKQGDMDSNTSSSGTQQQNNNNHHQHHLQLPKLGLSLATRTVTGWSDQSPKSSRCSSRCSSKCSSLQEDADGDQDRLQILASASMDKLEVEELSPAAAAPLPGVMPEPSIVLSTAPLPPPAPAPAPAPVPDLAPAPNVQVPREETRITLESPTVLSKPDITSAHAASPIIALTSHCNQSTIILMPAPPSKDQASSSLETTRPPPTTVTTPWLDREHFKTVFRELAKYTEQVEMLNDQILEAMTLYRFTAASVSASPSISASDPGSSTTATTTTTALPSSSSAAAAASSSSPQEDTRRRTKGKEKAVNLEEDRQCLATAFTELVLDSWPRVYARAPASSSPDITATTKAAAAAAESALLRARKDRAWTATQLKEAIVAFWEVHSHFHERAQLVMDVYEDPSELEQRDRIRLLKSRHLNNLLHHDPLPPREMNLAIDQFKAHSHAIASLLDQLQHVYLGLLLLLSDPRQMGSSSNRRRHHRWDVGALHLCGASSSSSSSSSTTTIYLDPSSDVAKGLGIGCIQISRNQLLALKVAILLLFGAGMIGMALVLNTR